MVKFNCSFVFGLFLSCHLYCANSPFLHTNPYLEIEKEYICRYFIVSDLNEHLPRLRKVASQCASATELGLDQMIATWGILMGLAENGASDRSYVGIAKAPPPVDAYSVAYDLAEAEGIAFEYMDGNCKLSDLPSTDLLYIDSVHTYCHLTFELEAMAPKVKKFIAIPYTCSRWSREDDAAYSGKDSQYPDTIDRSKRGLWTAVEDFLSLHPEWGLYEHFEDHQGFTILKRKGVKEDCAFSKKTLVDQMQALVSDGALAEDPSLKEAVDDKIKNHMILCTGPSIRRRSQLKTITERDSQLIPFKKVFMTVNDPDIIGITLDNLNFDFHYIEEVGHHIDCMNCLITTMKRAIADPDCCDDDIIIFKHESVFISDMHLLRKAIGKLVEGYDMVAKFRGVQFFESDVFLITLSAAKEVFKDFEMLNRFPPDIPPYCESYLTTRIVPKVPSVYTVPSNYIARKDLELGFYHVPPIWDHVYMDFWDKSNCFDLYRD